MVNSHFGLQEDLVTLYGQGFADHKRSVRLIAVYLRGLEVPPTRILFYVLFADSSYLLELVSHSRRSQEVTDVGYSVELGALSEFEGYLTQLKGKSTRQLTKTSLHGDRTLEQREEFNLLTYLSFEFQWRSSMGDLDLGIRCFTQTPDKE
jgi:hypothetical protein